MTIYTSSKVLPYVYMCVHKTTGEFYIGSRTTTNPKRLPSHLDLPKYRTSSKYVRELGFENFDWHIVAEFFGEDKNKDTIYFEQELIFNYFNNPLILNKICTLKGKEALWSTAGIPWSVEARRKRENKTLEEKQEIQRKRLNSLYPLSPILKEEIKNKKINTWANQTPEFKESLKNKKRETWSNQSLDKKNEITSKKRETWSNKTEEAKIETTSKRRLNAKSKPCMIDNIVYQSIEDAARVLDLCPKSVGWKLKCKKWKDWIFLPL